MNFFAAHGLGIHTIDGNFTSLNIVKTHQEIDHGGLPCACRTNNGHFLSWFRFSGKVMNNGLIW